MIVEKIEDNIAAMRVNGHLVYLFKRLQMILSLEATGSKSLPIFNINNVYEMA